VTVVVESRRDFTLANFRRVAYGGESIRVSRKAQQTMKQARDSFFRMLEADPEQFVYGVTSGSGMWAGRARRFEGDRTRRGVMSRHGGAAFGGGYLPDRVVRGLVFARLSSFLEGHAKVRPQIATELAAMLERPLPRIPVNGAMWAGETIYPSYLGDGMRIELELGEGLGNGSPVGATLAADVALRAPTRLALAERVFCLSIEAISAPLEAYDPDLVGLWGDPFEGRALRTINRLLQGAPKKGRRFYQAPVSWRLLPRVIGQAHRAIATLEEVAEVSLRSATMNPVYEPPTRAHPNGRAFSNGGYHNASATPAIDMINASWADLCTIADHHVTKMRKPGVSLLPDGLRHPGEGMGYGTGQVGLGHVDFVEEARLAAQRTHIPGAEGDPQDDIIDPVNLAWKKSLRADECLDSMLAVLAVIASQAFSVTERQPPPRLRDFLAVVRGHFPPVHETGRRRNLGRELEGLREAFTAATLAGDPDLQP
jgi:histidine ammonia-lyase